MAHGLQVGSGRERASERRGFTLLVMLGLLALLGLGLAAAGAAWRDQVQREREAEWLRVGELYVRAIESYVAKSPGTLKAGPASVNELLLDTRFVGLLRHLRQAYDDPMQPSQAWKLLRDGQTRIVGVYSDAPGQPYMVQPPANSRLQARPGAAGYARWAFVARRANNSSSNAVR